MTIAAISENHSEKDIDALFPGAKLQRISSVPDAPDPNIDAYIDLDFSLGQARLEKLAHLLPALVFVNAVTPTLSEIGLPFIRINAWPGFATRKIHELVIPDAAPATTPQEMSGLAKSSAVSHVSAAAPQGANARAQAQATGQAAQPAATADRLKALYQHIGCSYLTAPDIPGMISARVVAGIINEAWYTWEEKVSTKEEIDTAMRLGTNYPLGPFEWGDRIGLGQVVGLLWSLSKNDPRYTPAKSLQDAAQTSGKGK